MEEASRNSRTSLFPYYSLVMAYTVILNIPLTYPSLTTLAPPSRTLPSNSTKGPPKGKLPSNLPTIPIKSSNSRCIPRTITPNYNLDLRWIRTRGRIREDACCSVAVAVIDEDAASAGIVRDALPG